MKLNVAGLSLQTWTALHEDALVPLQPPMPWQHAAESRRRQKSRRRTFLEFLYHFRSRRAICQICFVFRLLNLRA